MRPITARIAASKKRTTSEVVDLFLTGDVATGKTVLRDYINAMIGFAACRSNGV